MPPQVTSRLAPAASARFAALKKDVSAVALREIGRLKEAMAYGRRWEPDAFREHLVGHPLLWHIVRRLVWLCEDGGTATAFRLAEDRTFADVHDDVLAPSEHARIGVAHPAELGDRMSAWGELFADYEVLQPFVQLADVEHLLTAGERMSGRLERFEGVDVPVERVRALVERGWDLGPGTRNGAGEVIDVWIARRVPGGRLVVVSLDPGLTRGDGEPSARRVVHVWLNWAPGTAPPDSPGRHRFGALDPVTVSEILADLVELTAPAV